MAIEAKVSFMNQLEKRLSAEVTVDVMGSVMAAVADVIEGFELQETGFNDNGPDDLLDGYLDALRVEGRSLKTIEQYRSIIGRMMKRVQVQTRKITVYHIRKFLAEEKERGIQESTLENYRMVFSGYFKWLQRESLIERNPVANLGAIKIPKKQKKIYSDVDMEKLHSACKTIRDRAIISFLASTGCRISEAMDLNRDEVDLERCECLVRGKGNKERKVFFDPVTGMLLKKYLDSRKDDNEALFIGLRHERLRPNGVRYMLKVLAKAAGVDQNVHPHKFRRTLATNLARHGMPIQEVANVLGHEKIDTTMKYVVMDPEAVKTSYRRYA